jgi:hypothetical protein
MNPTFENSYHLINEHRYIIKYLLSRGLTPEKIILEWDPVYHKRAAPSEQAINSIQRQINNEEDVEIKKHGPKINTVLTDKKLIEIKECVSENKFITNDKLSKVIKIPKTTAIRGKKILKLRSFDALITESLTEEQKKTRVEFCQSFLRWNEKYQMRVWWSDESSFSLDITHTHKKKKYYSEKNEFEKIEKKNRVVSVNVWAAIRGDGKVIFRFVIGKQTMEKYIDMLSDVFEEMEPKTSFLMQDGASYHRGGDALDWIKKHWGDRWIGLGSPRLTWGPKSMDLTPMDFTFWNYVKNRIAELNPETRAQLKDCIEQIMNSIDPGIIINMCQGVKERCRKCIRNGGGRFEGGLQE